MSPLDGNQVVAFVLLDVALILIAARVVGFVFTKIGQPRVVGEIVAGVLLGPTLLGATLWPDFVAPAWLHCQQALLAAPSGTVASPTWCLFPAQSRVVIGALGQVALLLFMFLAGLELDFSLLKGKVKAIFLVGLGVVGLPIVLGFVVGPVLATDVFKPETASNMGFVLFVGAMMAVTAFPVMVRILQEKGRTQSLMGAAGIAAAAVCTVAMFIAASVASSLAAGVSVGGLSVKLALSLVYLAAMLCLVRPLLARLAKSYEASGTLGSGFFALVLILLFASGYVAHLTGLTVIVGGFMVGLVMPVRKAMFADMSARLAELTGTILLPIFLAVSGLATDFTRLPAAALGGLALFLFAGIVSKWAGGAVFARAGGMTWAEGNVLGILMNCRGLLVLVVSLVGVQSNVITPVMQLGGVLSALITTAMTGPLFDRFVERVPAPPQSAVEPHAVV
jgi:Kef-type K+ transport system membrane component KefB